MGALTAVAAVRDDAVTSNVLITVRGLTAGTRTVTVNGVADLAANVAYGVTCTFNYVDVTIPAGYYDGAVGLKGSALRLALHDIIDNHTVRSYDYALTAFVTTDIKYNGKIWDVYSDVPGGTPPYEYDVRRDRAGGRPRGSATTASTRCRSRGSTASRRRTRTSSTSIPTDSYVNNRRANYPFGEVGTATWTSLNGSRLGASVSDGYTGTVFEPIDAFKGDLVRSHFYMSTRYFGEDGELAEQRRDRRRRAAALGGGPVPGVEPRRPGELEGAHAQRGDLRHPGQPQSVRGPSRVRRGDLRLELRRRRGGRRRRRRRSACSRTGRIPSRRAPRSASTWRGASGSRSASTT